MEPPSVTPRAEVAAVGVIAFGSLLTNPGGEIDAATADLARGRVSPFPVELARSNTMRGRPDARPLRAVPR